MEKNFLIIGQGKIGLPVTQQLAKKGFATTGVARGERTNYYLDSNLSKDINKDANKNVNNKINFIQADATQLTAEQLKPFTHIAIIVSPSIASLMSQSTSQRVESYRNTYLDIAKHIASLQENNQLANLERLVFISSTGVYGQNDGEWIDENSMVKPPSREPSNIILQAEQALQTAFLEKCIIIRPSGIYGVDRLMEINRAKAINTPSMPAMPPIPPMPQCAWTNRIMDTDLVNIIVKVLLTDTPKAVYLATDYQPMTSFELNNWLCQQLGTASAETDNTNTPQQSKQALEQKSNQQQSEQQASKQQPPATGKRIHSNIPLNWLKYPDWQAGYQMILRTIDNS